MYVFSNPTSNGNTISFLRQKLRSRLRRRRRRFSSFLDEDDDKNLKIESKRKAAKRSSIFER